MGIKGGIARKLLKEMHGTPEPPGSFDVDVLLFIDEYSVERRRAAREVVTGMKLGGLVLEPQDCEVLSKVDETGGSCWLCMRPDPARGRTKPVGNLTHLTPIWTRSCCICRAG